MTELQQLISLAPGQVVRLPPDTTRIRELEEENQKLLQRIEELDTQLEDKNAQLRVATAHRSTVLQAFDDRPSDYDMGKHRYILVGSVNIGVVCH